MRDNYYIICGQERTLDTEVDFGTPNLVPKDLALDELQVAGIKLINLSKALVQAMTYSLQN